MPPLLACLSAMIYYFYSVEALCCFCLRLNRAVETSMKFYQLCFDKILQKSNPNIDKFQPWRLQSERIIRRRTIPWEKYLFNQHKSVLSWFVFVARRTKTAHKNAKTSVSFKVWLENHHHHHAAIGDTQKTFISEAVSA